MKKLIILILSLNIFLFSSQTVQSRFLANYELKGIYVTLNGIDKKLYDGGQKDALTPLIDLDAAPGDLIKLIVDNANGGWAHGHGCFLINNECFCYTFAETTGHPYSPTIKETIFMDFLSKSCEIEIKILEEEIETTYNYIYQQIIPLPAYLIQCKNSLITYLNGGVYNLRLLDYIVPGFDTKYLEVTINENYKYFKLNNNQLQSNNRFQVNSNLEFSSSVSKKIIVKFINYGILSDNQECILNIRVCYIGCSNCNDLDANDNNHQCTQCKPGYFFIENTNNCMTKQEMIGTKYYFDETSQKFKKCFEDCLTCSIGGDSNDMKCDTCGFPKQYYAEPHNCIDDITHYYKDEVNNIYKKCYRTCYSCNAKSLESEHNCTRCEDNYHFIYNVKGKCITEDESPSNTYLDPSDNTYKLLSERCSSCDTANNCINCIREAQIIENILEMNEDFIQKNKNIIFQISTSYNQKNNQNNNISTINLGNCEKILKKKYNIDESLPLIIFKFDFYPPDTLIPIVEYEIYHPTNYSKLDLNYCENTFIKINVPVSIDENNLFKYDTENDYYDDYCNPYTTDEGTDIILIDRKKDFINNHLSLCQNNCEYKGYNKNNKKSICNCIAKNKMDTISDIISDPNKLSTKFKIEEIPGFGSNVKTIKCTYTLFSKDGLKKNISSYFLLTFISIFIASIILYKKYGYPLLQNVIKKILQSKKDFNQKKNSEQITYTNILKLKNNSYNNSKRRINSMANFPPKKNIINEININNDDINDIKIVDYNSQNENEQKSKFSEKEKGDTLTMNNNKKKRKKIIDDNISEFGSMSITRRDESKIKTTFNDYELNTLEYSDALLKDKRKYYEYYSSLIKRNQLIAFSFFPIKDYNLKIIKICIFCLSFALYYTTNYFYFSEKIIHKIYEDKGKYDFSYFLPKIIAAFFVAYFVTVIIKFVFLSERDISEIKSAETYYQANEIIPKIKRKITIKYIVFFTLGIIILIFLWFLISSFGSVFRNTQIIVLENTLISFAISLVYPFIYDIIPCIFRLFALKYRKKLLYNMSKILQIL